MKKSNNDLPFYTRFCPPPKCKVMFLKPSLTQQQFKEESDINNIIASVNAAGVVNNPLWAGSRQPLYGDFSFIQESDYMQAQNKLIEANTLFSELPAKVRQRFNNNPADLLHYLENNPDYEEMVNLGLVVKKELPSSVPLEGKTDQKSE